MLEFQVTSEQIAALALLTPDKLNRMVRPTLAATGTVETANIADQSVTLAKLSEDIYPMGYGVAAGTANAQTLVLDPPITAYANGQLFRLIPSAGPNTGATTLAVDGLAATKIVKNVWGNGVADFAELDASDLRVGRPVLLVYLAALFDGAGAFALLNDTANPPVLYAVETNSAGSPNEYVITAKPAVTDLAQLNGRFVIFLAGAVNTGACTLVVNGLAATSLKVADKDPLGGEIVANQMVVCVYHGGYFQILNPYRSRISLLLAMTDFSLGTVANLEHSLGRAPRYVQFYAVCTTIQYGYAVGDRVPIITDYKTGDSNIILAVNATNIIVRFITWPWLGGLNVGGGLIDPASWSLAVEASL